jgi:hypothetical protein
MNAKSNNFLIGKLLTFSFLLFSSRQELTRQKI